MRYLWEGTFNKTDDKDGFVQMKPVSVKGSQRTINLKMTEEEVTSFLRSVKASNTNTKAKSKRTKNYTDMARDLLGGKKNKIYVFSNNLDSYR